MKIGIIAAMPQELKILVEALENGEKHLRLGKVYYTGSIGRHEVVFGESGIGKVMSAMSVAVLANDFQSGSHYQYGFCRSSCTRNGCWGYPSFAEQIGLS